MERSDVPTHEQGFGLSATELGESYGVGVVADDSLDGDPDLDDALDPNIDGEQADANLIEVNTGDGDEFLSFRKEFGGEQGEVPTEEREEVAVGFIDYVTGVLDTYEVPTTRAAVGLASEEKHTVGLSPTKPEILYGGQRELRIEARVDGRPVVASMRTIEADRPYAEINIQGMVDGEAEGEGVYYNLTEGGEVIRSDLHIWPQDTVEVAADEPDTLAFEVYERDRAHGLNGQPIGTEEFSGLRSLIDAIIDGDSQLGLYATDQP